MTWCHHRNHGSCQLTFVLSPLSTSASFCSSFPLYRPFFPLCLFVSHPLYRAKFNFLEASFSLCYLHWTINRLFSTLLFYKMPIKIYRHYIRLSRCRMSNTFLTQTFHIQVFVPSLNISYNYVQWSSIWE